MKKFKVIGRYPILSIAVIATAIFIVGPIIFDLIIAGIIVLPMYLADQILGNKD